MGAHVLHGGAYARAGDPAHVQEEEVEPDVDADPHPERDRLRREVHVPAHADELVLLEHRDVDEEPLLVGLHQAQELEHHVHGRERYVPDLSSVLLSSLQKLRRGAVVGGAVARVDAAEQLFDFLWGWG